MIPPNLFQAGRISGGRARSGRTREDGPLIATGDRRKLGGMSTARDAATTDEELAGVVARGRRSGGSTTSAERAFRTLYDRHAGPLMAFLATRVRRADLEDIHQDAWRRAWEHLPDGFTGGQFRAWLFRIARNDLIDHGRKRRPEALVNDHPLTDHRHEPPEARLIEEERMTILRRCLDLLEPGPPRSCGPGSGARTTMPSADGWGSPPPRPTSGSTLPRPG